MAKASNATEKTGSDKDSPINEITALKARNLVIARKRKGWNQQKLAEAINKSKQTVMCYETCRNEISDEMMLVIAKAVDKNWLWFLQEHPDGEVSPTVQPSAKPLRLTEEQRAKWEAISLQRMIGIPDSPEDEEFLQELKVLLGDSRLTK